MTQDDITRMAREAGLGAISEHYGFVPFNLFGEKELERFAALVAEPWIETNKALAKEIIELKKQAEQEPVAWVAEDVCDGQFINGRKRRIWWECIDGKGMAIYATPVRTKDLTEEDINELWNTALMIADPTAGNLRFKFARAVIAKLREKERQND